MTATIIPIEQADIGGNIELCVNGDPYDLSSDFVGITSEDGFLIGSGIIETKFHPGIAGVGNHEITFKLTREKRMSG